jgi:hypothetical protein
MVRLFVTTFSLYLLAISNRMSRGGNRRGPSLMILCSGHPLTWSRPQRLCLRNQDPGAWSPRPATLFTRSACVKLQSQGVLQAPAALLTRVGESSATHPDTVTSAALPPAAVEAELRRCGPQQGWSSRLVLPQAKCAGCVKMSMPSYGTSTVDTFMLPRTRAAAAVRPVYHLDKVKDPNTFHVKPQARPTY